MTHRRRLLKAALAAPAAALAPFRRVFAAPLAPGGDAALFDLYADWLAGDAEMSATIPALEVAEQGARDHGIDWDDFPAVRAVITRQDAIWRAQQEALYAAALRPAASLEGIALKLAFWRRAYLEICHGQFAQHWDWMAFSAYCDVIAFADRRDLAHEDDKMLRDVLRKTARREGAC